MFESENRCRSLLLGEKRTENYAEEKGRQKPDEKSTESRHQQSHANCIPIRCDKGTAKVAGELATGQQTGRNLKCIDQKEKHTNFSHTQRTLWLRVRTHPK